MNIRTRTLSVVPLCACALVLGACANRVTEREIVREQPIVQQMPAQPAAAPERVVVLQPPPAPIEQTAPMPGGGQFTWVPGHYAWHDGWRWEPGQWVAGAVRPMPAPYREDPMAVAPPSGTSHWVPGYWELSGSDWVWRRGHWE
ncbi:MAG TPA: hypothetical protein VNU71_13795 [Burkholderiaceae bacterium]|nr:hypothetical protein [Burkholderiaceae bacterium]